MLSVAQHTLCDTNYPLLYGPIVWFFKVLFIYNILTRRTWGHWCDIKGMIYNHSFIPHNVSKILFRFFKVNSIPRFYLGMGREDFMGICFINGTSDTLLLFAWLVGLRRFIYNKYFFVGAYLLQF